MCYARVTRRVIEAAGRLRAIVKYGVGIDSIDLDCARERGLPVVNVPGYADDSVAEGAFALLLALCRKLKPLQQAMARNGWVDAEPRWLGRQLAGCTLGIVGLGRIGRTMARIAAALRMHVLAYSPSQPPDALRAAGTTPCRTLDELLAASDIVSLHCALRPDTRGLLGPAQLARMKPGALLVNVARGELVDEQALMAALRSGHLAGAALDVYGQEPLRLEGHPLAPLLAMEQVILSPHLAFYTDEAMRRLEEDTLARCLEALRGEPLLVCSQDARLRRQTRGVRFPD